MISGIGVGWAADEVCNLIVGCEKALGLASRLEAFHDALSPSGGLMAVLGSVIQPSMLAMLDSRHDRSLCGTVTGQLIGDHHARRYRAFGAWRDATGNALEG